MLPLERVVSAHTRLNKVCEPLAVEVKGRKVIIVVDENDDLAQSGQLTVLLQM